MISLFISRAYQKAIVLSSLFGFSGYHHQRFSNKWYAKNISYHHGCVPNVEMSNFPIQTAKRDVSSLSAPVAPSAAAGTASAKMTATENVDPNHAAKNPASAAAAGHKAGSPRKSAGGGKNISFSMQVGNGLRPNFAPRFSVLESRIVFPS